MFYLLILVAAASRFMPHPPNVTCVAALGLLAGCYLGGRRAYLVPPAILLMSDLFGQTFGIAGKGFYNPITMGLVYVGVIASVPVGRWMRSGQKLFRVPAGSLAASTIFFVVSNLGVWLGGWYPMTVGGLLGCYTSAIPFYGYTLAGDLAFTTLLFGAYELQRRGIQFSKPALARSPAA